MVQEAILAQQEQLANDGNRISNALRLGEVIAVDQERRTATVDFGDYTEENVLLGPTSWTGAIRQNPYYKARRVDSDGNTSAYGSFVVVAQLANGNVNFILCAAPSIPVQRDDVSTLEELYAEVLEGIPFGPVTFARAVVDNDDLDSTLWTEGEAVSADTHVSDQLNVDTPFGKRDLRYIRTNRKTTSGTITIESVFDRTRRLAPHKLMGHFVEETAMAKTDMYSADPLPEFQYLGLLPDPKDLSPATIGALGTTIDASQLASAGVLLPVVTGIGGINSFTAYYNTIMVGKSGTILNKLSNPLIGALVNFTKPASWLAPFGTVRGALLTYTWIGGPIAILTQAILHTLGSVFDNWVNSNITVPLHTFNADVKTINGNANIASGWRDGSGQNPSQRLRSDTFDSKDGVVGNGVQRRFTMPSPQTNHASVEADGTGFRVWWRTDWISATGSGNTFEDKNRATKVVVLARKMADSAAIDEESEGFGTDIDYCYYAPAVNYSYTGGDGNTRSRNGVPQASVRFDAVSGTTYRIDVLWADDNNNLTAMMRLSHTA